MIRRLPHGAQRLTLLASVLASLAAPMMLTAQIPSTAYAARRAAAIARLSADLLVVPSRGAFAADDQLGFSQAPDFQYLTGLDDQVGAVLVLDGHDRVSTLFVGRPSPLITHGVLTPGPAAAERLHVTQVRSVDDLESWLGQRLASAPTTVYVSGTDTRGAVATPLPMAASGLRWRSYLMGLGAANVEPATRILRPLRDIKSGEELTILRTVGKTSGAAFLAGLRALKPGLSERLSELAVVNACVTAGARSHSFWPWTKSGATGVPSALFESFQLYAEPARVMQAGELVRVDVGCQTAHYMGDVGRTAPVSGKFSPGQREAWDLFIAGYKAGLGALRDGATKDEVFETVLATVRRLAPTMTTPEGKQAAATLLGPEGTAPWELHGVGLDDAEGQPETLRSGMVIAYELMFAVGDDSFYLEDMLTITPEGYELLTPGLPYTASEIEAAMTGAPAKAAPARR